MLERFANVRRKIVRVEVEPEDIVIQRRLQRTEELGLIEAQARKVALSLSENTHYSIREALHSQENKAHLERMILRTEGSPQKRSLLIGSFRLPLPAARA